MDRDIAGIDVQRRALKTLTAIRDRDRRAVAIHRADVQNVVAVDAVVRGGDIQRAALNGQKLLGVDGIVHGRLNIQRRLADEQPGLALPVRRGAGFDAVFAVGVDVQRAAAADRDLRAVLALEDGVFGVGVVGIVVVVILFGVGQGVDRAVGDHERDAGGLVAGDRSGRGGGQLQPVQHEGDARRALFDLDRAVGARAGEHIRPGGVDRQRRAADLIAGRLALRDGDPVVGEGKDSRAAVVRSRGHGHEAEQQRQREQKRECLFHKNSSFLIWGTSVPYGLIVAHVPKANLKKRLICQNNSAKLRAVMQHANSDCRGRAQSGRGALRFLRKKSILRRHRL